VLQGAVARDQTFTRVLGSLAAIAESGWNQIGVSLIFRSRWAAAYCGSESLNPEANQSAAVSL